jgi:hypothetical protein
MLRQVRGADPDEPCELAQTKLLRQPLRTKHVAKWHRTWTHFVSHIQDSWFPYSLPRDHFFASATTVPLRDCRDAERFGRPHVLRQLCKAHFRSPASAKHIASPSERNMVAYWVNWSNSCCVCGLHTVKRPEAIIGDMSTGTKMVWPG